MSARRRKPSREFKIEEVGLLENGKSGKEVEETLGIASGMVYRWRRQLETEGVRAFPGNGNLRDEELADCVRKCGIYAKSEISCEKQRPSSRGRGDEVPFHRRPPPVPPRGEDGRSTERVAQQVLRRAGSPEGARVRRDRELTAEINTIQ